MTIKIPKVPNTYGYVVMLFCAVTASTFATLYYFYSGLILAYGDAESHINIAKRVVDSLTPGFGQLGGVWLPLQHLMMVPFVWNDFLWRSGLGGSTVSMICYIAASIGIYKIVYLLTKNILHHLLGHLFLSLTPISYIYKQHLLEKSLL